MQTFQHRLVVVLKAEGVDNEMRANLVAREHIDFWCRTHVNDETGEVPDERMPRLVAEGKSHIRAVPNEKVLRLFLSRHIPRSVVIGQSAGVWLLRTTFQLDQIITHNS